MKNVLVRAAGPTLLLCVASLSAACAGSDGNGGSGEDDLSVRVMHAAPVEAGTNVWVPAHHDAYTEVADEYGWDVEYAETVPYGQAAQVLDRWGREGVDLVFVSDNGYEASMISAAEAHPDTNFVMMSELSTDKNLQNVAAYTIDWCDLGYVQGVAGALVSDESHIGVVSSLEILPVQLLLSGMRVGAEDAVAGTDVTVRYTGDFVDVAKHQEAASALINAGADVISGAATLSPPVAVRVQEEGQTFIGTFADESPSAPQATATSVVIEFKLGYEEVAEQMREGEFEPGVRRLGYADDFVKLLPFTNGHESVSETADELLGQLRSSDVDLSECRADQGE